MIISIDIAKTSTNSEHSQENVNIKIREGNIQLALYLLTKD